MKKITLIGLFTVLAVLLFGISSFAANNIASDAVNGIRNVVGGAENAIGGAAAGITNGIRNGVSGVENVTENTIGTMTTNRNNATGNTMGSMTTDTNNGGGYNATRTATTRMATTGATGTFLGMGATAWGWLIMATVGIITVALVWYYGKERELNYNHNSDNY